MDTVNAYLDAVGAPPANGSRRRGSAASLTQASAAAAAGGAGGASGVRTGGSTPLRQQQVIDAFLAAVRHLADSSATPSDADLATTRRFVAHLSGLTAVDHLRSVDEALAVPAEFEAAKAELATSEAFLYLAAAGQVVPVAAALDRDWRLLHALDRDGHTALHAAAAQDATEVATELLRRGAAVDAMDYEGLTPLAWAVEANAQGVGALLVDAGADPTLRSNTGTTAADAALKLKAAEQEVWRGILALARRSDKSA